MSIIGFGIGLKYQNQSGGLLTVEAGEMEERWLWDNGSNVQWEDTTNVLIAYPEHAYLFDNGNEVLYDDETIVLTNEI